MAKDKSSFLLYNDQRGIFKKLNDTQAGKLIKHIFSYCDDENPKGDFVTELAFESIMRQLKRDLKKYEKRAVNSRNNGKKGGRPSKKNNPNKPDKPSGLKNNPDKPKKPVTVTGTVTVTGAVTGNESRVNTLPTSIEFDGGGGSVKSFVTWFNDQKKLYSGRQGKFKALSPENERNYKKLKEHSLEDFKTAAASMSKSKWVIDNGKFDIAHFLRVDNFNKYLNQDISKQRPTYNPKIAERLV